jgi:putative ABC transport system permease protein
MNLFSKMALKNIWKNKRRSFATGTSIAAGFAGLCLLGGYILRVEKYLQVNSIYINHSGHLSVYKKGGLDLFFSDPKTYQLTGAELQWLQDLLKGEDQVDMSVPILRGMGLMGNGKKSVPFLGYGIDPLLEKRLLTEPEVLKWTKELVSNSSQRAPTENLHDDDISISTTKELGSLLGLSPPFNKLSDDSKDIQLAARTLDGNLNAVSANLAYQHATGFALMDDTSLITPLKLMQTLFDTDGATYLAIFLKPGVSISHFRSRFQKAFTAGQQPFEIFPYDDDRISLFYVGTMGFLYIMAGFFVFLIFTAVALSIINSMSISILERAREIGTLRAIGFNQPQTAWLLTLESLYLTLTSLSVGFILAQTLAALVNRMNIRFHPPGVSGDLQFVLLPEPWFCFTLMVPLLIVSITCAFLVSRKILKQAVINLLQEAH